MLLSLTANNIEETANTVSSIINNGGIGVIPTDTLYGIVCSANNKDAVEKIYDIKDRERTKPFLVLIPSFESALSLVDDIPSYIKEFSPGPLTFILPLKNGVSFSFTKNTIAMRLPKDDFLNALLPKTGIISAPSANPSDIPPSADVKKVKEWFLDRVDFFVDGGNLSSNVASTIFDCTNKKCLREGAIPKEEIEKAALS